MKEVDWDLYFARIDIYLLSLIGLATVALVGFSLLSKEQKRKKVLQLSISIVVLVAFYENLGGFIGSQKIVNLWVFNLFNIHIAAILFLLLIRTFLKKKIHKKIVNLLIVLFLLISAFLHLTGITQFNESGEYLSFLNSIMILSCCGLYFFELITLNEFLDINPLREFSFWVTTVILFYISSSFMIYISYTYLYTHHLDIFYMVIEIPKQMTILCNLLLCLGIYSKVIKNVYQHEIIHV
jgi:hypothetical protein